MSAGEAVPPCAVYKIKEVSHMLGLSVQTVTKGIKSGEIPGSLVCGTYIIPKETFDQWLQNMRMR